MPVFSAPALKKRFAALANRCADSGVPSATRFLTPAEAELAVAIGKKSGVYATVSGGYPNAERMICLYHIQETPPAFPVSLVRVQWDARFAVPGHRDLLGSVLALGVDRSCVGDIVIGKTFAVLCVANAVASFITDSLVLVGRVSVHCTLKGDLPENTVSEVSHVKGTVASLRADCVLCLGARVSRATACEWVRAGRVFLNHEPCLHTDAHVKTGDVLSVRGYGRIVLANEGSPTRKDRIPIMLELYK